MQDILGSCYRQCEDILKAHMEELRQVSDYLLDHETMSGKEFEAIMNHTATPAISDLSAEPDSATESTEPTPPNSDSSPE